MRSTLLLTLGCAFVSFVVAQKCTENLQDCTVTPLCCGRSKGFVCTALTNGETGSFCITPVLGFGNFYGTALDFIPASTATKATAAIIFLHGLSMSGVQMKQYILSLIGNKQGSIVGSEHIKWVFPSGPLFTLENSALKKFVAIQGPTRGWFDADLGTPTEQAFGCILKSRPSDLAKSTSYINRLISKLGSEGIPPSRIVLAGFSEGGTLALNTALTYSRQLAGAVSIAGPLLPPVNRNTFTSLPIWIAAGFTDQLIPFYSMQNVARFLNPTTPMSNPYTYPYPSLLDFGMKDVTFKGYVTDNAALKNHVITPEEAAAAWSFMQAKLPVSFVDPCAPPNWNRDCLGNGKGNGNDKDDDDADDDDHEDSD